MNIHCVEYQWQNADGELDRGGTVLIGPDAAEELRAFKARNPHLLDVRLLPENLPEVSNLHVPAPTASAQGGGSPQNGREDTRP